MRQRERKGAPCPLSSSSSRAHRTITCRYSPTLASDEAEKQLSLVARMIGTVDEVRLPWFTATGDNVISAQILDDGEPASGGGSVMAGVMHERW